MWHLRRQPTAAAVAELVRSCQRSESLSQEGCHTDPRPLEGLNALREMDISWCSFPIHTLGLKGETTGEHPPSCFRREITINAGDFRCCFFGQDFRSHPCSHRRCQERSHEYSCSICTKKQNRHFIVPASRFKLLKGADNLTTYTFNTHRAQHTFCKTCGVQSFYTPRSNPDGYGIAPHCLDDGTVQTIVTEDINGKEWEKAVKEHKTIRDMSKP
ncbi:centromere protein V isoform X3 [Apus apus]|uniref:centromere protein V isoform X3 n=1 Tax=Apus apus TaxID=8895 RepID=UPI0021F885D3|nr:centromere protein V isoform X3 [Apus apus]